MHDSTTFREPVEGFEEACQRSVNTLRAALISVYDSAGLDIEAPQDVARKLRINKTLTWTLARLLQSTDGLAAVQHVPGLSSIEKVLQAIQQEGAEEASIAIARNAAIEFQTMIEAHAGDRPTLDLMVDALGSGDDDKLEMSRKLAFRGNSGVFGVQARTRLACWFLGVNEADSNRIDMVPMQGYVGFRRLRPNVPWRLVTIRSWSDHGDFDATRGPAPLDPAGNSSPGVALITPFLRGNVPTIHRVNTHEGIDIMLGPGAVGNEGVFDVFRGEIMRSVAARFADGPGETGECALQSSTPVENMVMDLVFDRRLSFVGEAAPIAFNRYFAQGERTPPVNDSGVLPISMSRVELPGDAPMMATPLVPRYQEIAGFVFDKMGWDARRFRAVRVRLKYPPMGSTVVMRFPLPMKID